MLSRLRANNKNAVQKIKQARVRKGFKWDDPRPLIEASKLIDKRSSYKNEFYDGVYADGINPSSWRRYLLGEKISRSAFMAYSHILEIPWQDLVQDYTPEDLLYFSSVFRVNHETDASQYIEETVKDGTICFPGQVIHKTWTIKNVGSLIWSDRYLTRVGVHDSPYFICSPKRIEIPLTYPGEQVRLEMQVVLPRASGSYVANFKMMDRDENLFFPDRYQYGLFCSFIVDEGFSERIQE